MLERLLTEIPQFFSYYNLIFLGQAMLATIGLSAIGCLTGVLAGLGLALLRLPKGVM